MPLALLTTRHGLPWRRPSSVNSCAIPDLAPPPPAFLNSLERPAPAPPPAASAGFDFRTEMRLTRVRADELLAAGQIAEAEAYMEQRRLYFWENGYRLRKLNQAYFA